MDAPEELPSVNPVWEAASELCERRCRTRGDRRPIIFVQPGRGCPFPPSGGNYYVEGKAHLGLI